MTSPRRLLVLVSVLFEGGLGGLAWLLGLLLHQPCGETFHWDWGGAAGGVAASLPLLLVFWLCLWRPVGPLTRIKQFCREVVRPIFAPCTVFDLALMSACAGIGEELLFRGVIQAALSRPLGPALGLAVASLLFGLLHPITPAYIVLAALMGAYLGAVWLAGGNLLVVIIAHGLYDFLILFYLVRVPEPHPPGAPG